MHVGKLDLNFDEDDEDVNDSPARGGDGEQQQEVVKSWGRGRVTGGKNNGKNKNKNKTKNDRLEEKQKSPPRAGQG